MKKMKKLLICLSCLITMISSSVIESFATEKLIAQSDKYINQNIVDLYKNALKKNKTIENAAVVVDENQKTENLAVYEIDTSNIIENESDIKSRTYITTYANHNSTIGDYDDSLGVYAYVTIYYRTKGTEPEEYLLTSVSGGYTIVDSTISVTKQTVTYGCNGTFPTAISSQTATKYPGTSSSWSYSTGFTTYVTDEFAAIGCNNLLNLKRRGSTWTLRITNNIAP